MVSVTRRQRRQSVRHAFLAVRVDRRRLGLDASDSALRLDADAIIDSAANALLAAQITLSRLDGDVPEKKLYLLQFSTSGMAQPGARSAKIVRRKSLDGCFVGVLPDDVPDGFFGQSIAPGFLIFVYPPEKFAGGEVGGLKPLIYQGLQPAGHRYRPRMTRFALQVNDGPVVLSLLYVPEVQAHRLVPPKAACKQDGQ